jgi:hypothetical protein
MSIQNNVKDWVTIDNSIKKLNQELRDLREERKAQEEAMISWADSHSSGSKPVIKISDGKLRFVETKQMSPLTLKFVSERALAVLSSLPNLSSSSAEAIHDMLMEDLKTNRECKVVREIKRSFDK